jgi:DNA-binding NtrC family response regulator
MASEQSPPRVTLHVRDDALRARLHRALRDAHVEVTEGGPPLPGSAADLVVLVGDQADGRVGEVLGELLDGEDAPAVVVLSDAATASEQAGMSAGGVRAVLSPGASTREIRGSVIDLARAAAGMSAAPRLADFATRSPSMTSLVDLARRVSTTRSTVLICGETGVGKERLARAIHAEGERAGKPFVSVNAAAIPENLLESELFGHVRGSFTGASETRRGCFVEAAGGTLFLDEIGEMPLHLQVKLLHVLQDGSFRPVGSEETETSDARVIAATNRDLADAVAEGRFRQDLLYRLDVVRLEIPPLRERREDIPQLVGRLLRHLRVTAARPEVTGLTEGALERLVAHDWPGNVREMMNVLERALLLTEGARIGEEQLPEGLGATARTSAVPGGEVPSDWLDRTLPEVRDEIVERVEKAYLAGLLERTGGRVGEAAERAGISTRSMYDRMRRFGLQKEDFKP